MNSFSIKAQKWEWLQTIRPGGDEYAWDMTNDSQGNVIVTGRVKATSTFGWAPATVTPPWHSGTQTDAFLVKYRPNGTMVWAKRDGGKEQDWGRGVTTDSLGNIFVTGEFRDTAYFAGQTVYSVVPGTVANMYLAKYDSSGNCLWVAHAGNTTQSTIGHGVTLDPSGNIYITGFMNGISDFGNGITAGTASRHLGFVAKYSPAGVCQWVKPITSQIYSNGNDIVYSKGGYLYNTGEFKGTLTVNGVPYVGTGTTYEEIYTCKLDVNGNFIWAAIAKGNGTDLSNRVDVDDNDNVYVAGQFEQTVTFAPGITVVSNANNDGFLVKYNKNGIVKWSTAMVGAGNDYTMDVKVYKNKEIYISGHVAVGTFTLGTPTTYTCGGSWSIVVCYDTAGVAKWYKLGGGTGINNSHSVTLDTAGNIFSAGFFNTNLVLDTIVTTSPGSNGYDVSTAKLFPPLNPSVTSSNPRICFGSTIQYNVSQAGSPITYQWSFPGGSPSTSTVLNPLVTYSTPGIYNVQLITRNHHETDTLMLTSYVTVDNAPVVNLGSDIAVCAGQSVLLNGGMGMISYLWNNGSTNPTLSVTTSGQYYVAVTNACGTARDTISVTTAPAPIVNIGADTSICSGQSRLLDAGSGMTIYTWNTGANIQTTSVSVSGQYYVTVTGSNGCSASDSMMLTVNALPTVNIGADTLICQGQSVLINAGTGMSSYMWNTSATSQVITASTAGMYYVNVSDMNGCSGSDSMMLSLNPSPVINLGTDTSICSGQSVLLDAGSGMSSYMWSDASTGQTISASLSGQYFVNVLGANGCSSADSIQVTVNSYPVVDLGNDTTVCQGQNILLDAGSGMTSYAWSNASATQTISVSVAGNYYVSVANAGGCVTTDTIQLNVNPLPVVNLGNDTLLCQPQTDVMNAGSGFANYLWNDGTTIQTDTAIVTGVYSVVVTAGNGCSGTDSVSVIIDPCLNVESTTNEFSVSIYPNPIIENAILDISGMEKDHTYIFTLLNTIGEIVLMPMQISNGQTLLPTQGLAKGVYIYQVRSSQGAVQSGKLIIQ